MARTASPSMPTPHQIREAHEIVRALYPAVRIKAVGPDGVIFDYPDARMVAGAEWHGKPFSGDVK